MKHDVLRSVAHNIAASLAGGVSLLIGVYDLDVFGDARRSETGEINIDFLNGTISGVEPSPKLTNAVRLYRDALPILCGKHEVSVSDFAALTACYWYTPTASHFVVTIRDRTGRESATEYSWPDGHRTITMDNEGRRRPKAIRRSGLKG
jgi:hypothetical protein